MAASKLLLVAALAILLRRCALADDPDGPTTLPASTLGGPGGHSGDASSPEGSRPPRPSQAAGTGASSVPTPGLADHGDGSALVEAVLAGSAASQWSSSGTGEAGGSPPGHVSYDGEESDSSEYDSSDSESDSSGGSYDDDGDDTAYDLLRLFGV